MPEPNDTSGHLHRAFYGPSIPSSSTPSSRSKDFSAYTILCVAFKMTTIVLIIMGIAVVTLWLIFQPKSLEACAVAASLTTFDLPGPGDGGLLGYNLTVKLTFRNPNTKYNMYYDRMHAQAIYSGQLLGSARFPRMHQLRKSTMPVAMRFLGLGNVTGESVKRNFGREKGEGFFYLSVKVYTTVRLKMVLIKSVKFKPDVDCFLRLPVPTNATSLAAGFTATECDVHNFS